MDHVKKGFLAIIVLAISLFTIQGVDQASAATSHADGEYSIPFTILKGDGDGASMTNDYVSSPATLIIKDGKYTVQLTLANSSWWEYFKVNGSDVTVVSNNEGADTSIVQFPVSNITEVVPAKVHVIVPDINYDNKYDIRIQFDASSIPTANSNSDSSSKEKTETKTSNTDTPSKENESNNNTSSEGNNTSNTNSSEVEVNPPTSDNAPIEKYVMLLIISSALFFSYRFIFGRNRGGVR